MAPDFTAVIDIGKTHRKLLVLDDAGQVLHAVQADNQPQQAARGYLALDTENTREWLCESLAALGPMRARLRRIVPTTHGAAMVALRDGEPVLPVADYEFTGFDENAGDDDLDAFESTLSPRLPRGLNLGRQLVWLQRHAGAALADADTLLPYAQYWAAWLSGVAASEVSSLGCHSHLWLPREHRYSAWARRHGWAGRFAPLRRAWEVLGTVRAPLGVRLGLPPGLQVLCGAHDSNACLARYLRAWPRMTLVSTGTWVVVMASGAPAPALNPALDLLGNVSVRGELVPTARFMGGREVEHLCAGADPALADLAVLDALLARNVMVRPGFESQGGPFRKHRGCVVDCGQALDHDAYVGRFNDAERATLAALYAAQVTAWLIEHLRATSPVVLEGPFARNPVICQVLADLLPPHSLHASVDPVEGTARGSWILGRWTAAHSPAPRVQPIAADARAQPLRAHHAQWCERHASAALPLSV